MFSSCIKDELPNVEADIEDIMIPQMNAITSSRIDESRATVYLRKGMVNLITDMGVDADLIWMTSPWPVFCFPFFPNEKLGVKFLII